MASRRHCTAILVLLLACSAGPVSAQQGRYYCYGGSPPGVKRHCPWEITLGLTGGPLTAADRWGWHAGTDVSVGAFMRPWVGAGGHLQGLDGRISGFVYGEVGFWLALNLGVGGGVRFGDEVAAGPHLFLGLPLPVPGRVPRSGHFYLEPYYRPAFLFDSGRMVTHHEFGVMIKYWTHRGNYDEP